MNKALSKVLVWASVVVPSAVFAEGESSNWDFTTLTTEIQALSTSYKAFFTAALIPAAVTIIGCGVILYVLGRSPRSVGLGKK